MSTSVLAHAYHAISYASPITVRCTYMQSTARQDEKTQSQAHTHQQHTRPTDVVPLVNLAGQT